MREKMMRFMAGRYGMDEFAKAESVLVLVLLVLAIFIRPLDLLAIALMVHLYFRIFSRNIQKRYAENQRWLNFRYKAAAGWTKKKTRWAQRSIYRYFHCPQCRQEVRVPAGHGKICITCPKCRTEFVKKS